LNAQKKFVALSTTGQLSIVALAAGFLLSFAFFVLPEFLGGSMGLPERGWFLVSWNLPGPLMFISVFRIHALRVISEHCSGKREVLGITRWVRFWFSISMAFGALSIAFLTLSDLWGVLPLPTLLATVGIVALWLILVVSTLGLLKMGHYQGVLGSVERVRERERILLGLTSIVFLIFTGFSSIMISLP
jgi:hypothetical protein